MRYLAAWLALFAGLWAAAAGPAVAHPHVWIDMRSAAILDAEGRVAAVRIEWTFDRFYSSFAEQDMDTDRSGTVSEAEAGLWAETAFENIAVAGYFTEILVDGQSYAPTRAEQPVGRWLDGRLFMSFVVRLDEPVDPRAVPVGFMSYDPMFYIDVRHPDGDGAATVEGRAARRARPASGAPSRRRRPWRRPPPSIATTPRRRASAGCSPTTSR